MLAATLNALTEFWPFSLGAFAVLLGLEARFHMAHPNGHNGTARRETAAEMAARLGIAGDGGVLTADNTLRLAAGTYLERCQTLLDFAQKREIAEARLDQHASRDPLAPDLWPGRYTTREAVPEEVWEGAGPSERERLVLSDSERIMAQAEHSAQGRAYEAEVRTLTGAIQTVEFDLHLLESQHGQQRLKEASRRLQDEDSRRRLGAASLGPIPLPDR